MRELGRTPIAPKTVDPHWHGEEAFFTAKTVRGQDIEKCTLEFEVFDADDPKKKGDFLGYLRLTGPTLQEYFDKGSHEESCKFTLGPSFKFSSEDNKHAQGTITIRGALPDLVKARAEEKKRIAALLAAEQRKILPAGLTSGISSISNALGSGLAGFGGFFRGAKKNDKSKDKVDLTESVQPAEKDHDEAMKQSQQQQSMAAAATAVTTGPSVAASSVVPSTVGAPSPVQLLERTQITGAPEQISHTLEGVQVVDKPDLRIDAGESSVEVGVYGKDKQEVKVAVVDESEDDEDEEEATAPTLPVNSRIYMNLITTDDVPTSTLLVKLNDVEVSRISIDTKLSSRVELNHFLEISLPPTHFLSDCKLSFEVWNHFNSRQGLRAVYTRKGMQLVKLFRRLTRESQWLTLESKQGKPKTQSQKFATRESKILISGVVYDEAARHLLMGPKSYALSIYSGKNIRKTDTFAARDVYVTIAFNGDDVGVTSIQKNAVHPQWRPQPAEIAFTAPAGRPLDCCKLDITVKDANTEESLGSIVLTGSDLVDFLEGARAEPTTYALSSSAYSKRAPAVGTPKSQYSSLLEVGVQKKDKKIPLDEIARMVSTILTNHKGRGLLTLLQNQMARSVEIFIVSARNLPPVALDGNR